MKKRFGIKRTKMNIFWLFLAGLLIGIVLGLRHPVDNQIQPESSETSPTEEGER